MFEETAYILFLDAAMQSHACNNPPTRLCGKIFQASKQCPHHSMWQFCWPKNAKTKNSEEVEEVICLPLTYRPKVLFHTKLQYVLSVDLRGVSVFSSLALSHWPTPFNSAPRNCQRSHGPHQGTNLLQSITTFRAPPCLDGSHAAKCSMEDTSGGSSNGTRHQNSTILNAVHIMKFFPSKDRSSHHFTPQQNCTVSLRKTDM